MRVYTYDIYICIYIYIHICILIHIIYIYIYIVSVCIYIYIHTWYMYTVIRMIYIMIPYLGMNMIWPTKWWRASHIYVYIYVYIYIYTYLCTHIVYKWHINFNDILWGIKGPCGDWTTKTCGSKMLKTLRVFTSNVEQGRRTKAPRM